MPGPIKKEAERRRTQGPISGNARHGELRPVTRIPAANAEWHKRAKDWYNALAKSGQSDYYQASDWAKAQIVGDLLTFVYESRFYRCAAVLAEINSMMSSLGTSEGDRRQVMRVELELPVEEEDSASTAAQAVYANLLGQPQAK